MPELWFEQAGWLGAILKDHDVKIAAEQLLKTQALEHQASASEDFKTAGAALIAAQLADMKIGDISMHQLIQPSQHDAANMLNVSCIFLQSGQPLECRNYHIYVFSGK